MSTEYRGAFLLTVQGARYSDTQKALPPHLPSKLHHLSRRVLPPLSSIPTPLSSAPFPVIPSRMATAPSR